MKRNLLAALTAAAAFTVISTVAASQPVSQDPPSQETEIWTAFFASDKTKMAGDGLGDSELEAKVRAKKKCGQADCTPFLSFKIVKGVCFSLAQDPTIPAGRRAIFGATAKSESEASEAALTQCKATGGTACTKSVAHCF